MSPVHPSSSSLQQHRTQDLDFASPMDSVKMEDDIETPPLQTLSPQLTQRGFPSTSPSRTRDTSGNSSSHHCPNCLQEHGPDDAFCWRCLEPLTHVPQTPPTPQENFPVLTPLQIQQMQYAKAFEARNGLEQQRQHTEEQMGHRREQEERITVARKAQEQLHQQQLAMQRQRQLQLLQQQRLVAQQQQMFQQSTAATSTGPMNLAGAHSQLALMAERQRQAQQQQMYSVNLQRAGTSSNPISLDDSPPHVAVGQRNPFVSLPSRTPSVLNNGWQSGYHPPVARPAQNPVTQNYPSYMYPSYDWTVPGPSTEEIKDLLSNIRPDEDIKVEDKDAIIDGMAPQMRLMKHQQVFLSLLDVI